jgi:integrase
MAKAKELRERRPLGTGWIGKVKMGGKVLDGYYFKVRLPDGRRVQRWGGDTETAAQAAMNKFVREFKPSKETGLVAKSLAGFVDTFIDAMKARGRVPEHVANVRSIVERAAKYFDASTVTDLQGAVHPATMDRIGAIEAQKYIDALAAGGVVDGVKVAPLAAASVRRHVSALSKCWSEALKARLVTANVWRGLELPKVEEAERPYIDAADVLRIYAVLPAEHAPLIVTAFETGARLGELRKLTWRQVASDNSSISFVGKTTKSKRTRTVHTTPRVQEALARLRDARPASPLRGAPDLVFPTVSRTTPRRVLKRVCKDLKLPFADHVRFHDARHFVATMLLRAGTPPSDIAARLGHRDSQLVNQRYGVHAPSSADREAAETMARVMGSAPATKGAAAG